MWPVQQTFLQSYSIRLDHDNARGHVLELLPACFL